MHRLRPARWERFEPLAEGDSMQLRYIKLSGTPSFAQFSVVLTFSLFSSLSGVGVLTVAADATQHNEQLRVRSALISLRTYDIAQSCTVGKLMNKLVSFSMRWATFLTTSACSPARPRRSLSGAHDKNQRHRRRGASEANERTRWTSPKNAPNASARCERRLLLRARKGRQ